MVVAGSRRGGRGKHGLCRGCIHAASMPGRKWGGLPWRSAPLPCCPPAAAGLLSLHSSSCRTLSLHVSWLTGRLCCSLQVVSDYLTAYDDTGMMMRAGNQAVSVFTYRMAFFPAQRPR